MKSISPIPIRSVNRQRGAFTLIELLVVIAIIIILAGLLLTTAGYVNEKAGNDRAKAEIALIETALKDYQLENGTFPDGNGNDTSTKKILDELVTGPITKPNDYGNRKPFEFPPKMLDAYKPGDSRSYEDIVKASTKLVDPFGNPYHYYFDSTAAADNDTSKQNPVTSSINNGPSYFDVWSYGKGGDSAKTVPAKWIKNW